MCVFGPLLHRIICSGGALYRFRSFHEVLNFLLLLLLHLLLLPFPLPSFFFSPPPPPSSVFFFPSFLLSVFFLYSSFPSPPRSPLPLPPPPCPPPPFFFFFLFFISWLTHSLFSSMAFNLHVSMVFADVLLWLTFIVLLSEKVHGMISVFLYLWRSILWRNMGYVLRMSDIYALVKNVYSAVLGWNDLNISVKSIWATRSLKAMFPYFLFRCHVHCCQWGVKVTYLYCIAMN